MLEIRFHGRGGMGAVTSAELVAMAAIEQGKYAQSMPSFGPERRGAPVLAYLRVSDEPIRIRAEVTRPDIVVVLDDSLLHAVDVTSGLKKDGLLVINSTQSEDSLRRDSGFGGRIAAIDALGIAMECLGVPITNTTMIGALIKAKDIIPLDSLIEQLKNRFNPKLAEKNITAMKKAYDTARVFAPKEVRASDKKVKLQREIKKILPGAAVENPGSSKDNLTGDWRSQIPIFDQEKCSKCGLCYIFCPDAAITIKEDGYIAFDYDYCKGCGICAIECPKDAIAMERIKKK